MIFFTFTLAFTLTLAFRTMLGSQPVDVLTSMFSLSLSLSLALSFSLSFLLSLSFSLAFLLSLSGRCLARSRWMCSLPWLTWSPFSYSLWKHMMPHYVTFWKVFLDLPGSLLWGQSNFGDVRILAAPDISLCNFLRKKVFLDLSGSERQFPPQSLGGEGGSLESRGLPLKHSKTFTFFW